MKIFYSWQSDTPRDIGKNFVREALDAAVGPCVDGASYTIVDRRYLRRSVTFDAWLTNLRDSNAQARIAARIDRLAMGSPGDVKPVGARVSELRVDYGSGCRVYYAQSDRIVFLLLCGGTKATQDADIKLAIEMNTARARQASEARRQKPRKGK